MGVGSLQLRTWQTLSMGQCCTKVQKPPLAISVPQSPTGSLEHVVGLELKFCVPDLV